MLPETLNDALIETVKDLGGSKVVGFSMWTTKGEPFAACYWDTAEGRVFGLRATDDGVDVSEVAKQYGGGGHAKAAGFKVPRGHVLAVA